VEYKKCSKCGKEKPATLEYFNRHKNGLQSWCKECKKADHLAHREERNKKALERYYRLHPKEEIPEGLKKCSCCKQLKPATNEYYSLNKRTKDGFAHRCKECRRQAEYWTDPESVREKRKQYYQENKGKVLQLTKQYKIENLDWYHKYNKRYYKQNEARIKETSKKNHYKRIKEDIGYRLLQRCRKRLYEAIKGNVKSKRTVELIGCSVEKLMEYLESQFTDGMSWNNYGKWHVDHIKPCAMFDFSKLEQQQECFHYTNLRPLWAEDNIRKSAKYEEAL